MGAIMNERLHMRAQIQVTTAAGSMVQVDCDNCWAVRLVLQACSQATFEEQSKGQPNCPPLLKVQPAAWGQGPCRPEHLHTPQFLPRWPAVPLAYAKALLPASACKTSMRLSSCAKEHRTFKAGGPRVISVSINSWMSAQLQPCLPAN